MSSNVVFLTKGSLWQRVADEIVEKHFVQETFCKEALSRVNLKFFFQTWCWLCSLEELRTSVVSSFLYNSSKPIYSRNKWDSLDPLNNKNIWYGLNITRIKRKLTFTTYFSKLSRKRAKFFEYLLCISYTVFTHVHFFSPHKQRHCSSHFARGKWSLSKLNS